MQTSVPEPEHDLVQRWWEFYARFLNGIHSLLQTQLPTDLSVCIVKRTYFEHQIGDIESVSRPQPPPHDDTSTQRMPVIINYSTTEIPFSEDYIEVRESEPNGRVVTCLDVVRPSNKQLGSNRDNYCRNRDELVMSDISYVQSAASRR
jgi:hypothetical protein